MISHHHKCIFVHIPKCAGQSIEHVFLSLLGLTWETRAPLLLRPNDRPELGPPRLAHLRADQYVACKYIPQDMFDQYFTFSFVRNPWSRSVSLYRFLGYDRKMDFKKFLLHELKNRLVEEERWFVGPQSDFLCGDDGRILVDHVGRFENLQNDFDAVCDAIGIPLTRLPHINASSGKNYATVSRARKIISSILFTHSRSQKRNHDHWKDYFDKESIDCIYRLYERDIELFGYNFE